MKKKMIMMCFLVATLVVNSETLEHSRRRAETMGAEKAKAELIGLGVRGEGKAEAILESWDEQLVVDTALEEDAISFLAGLQERDGLRAENARRVLAHEQAKPEQSAMTWRFAIAVPPEQRQEFNEMLEKLVPGIFQGRPVAGEMALKYRVRLGQKVETSETETADLVSMLLAPEPMYLFLTERLKEALKNQAVRMARVQLRAQGRTFVVRNGINPLMEAVRPVVDALNAPMCEGLEAALRGLGAEVADRDRDELQALTAQWRDEVLAGDLQAMKMTEVLGRLSVGLGVKGFNTFVEEYNHGSGDVDDEGR